MHHNERGVLPLRPDLLVEAPDGRRLVIDTKWKRLGESGTRGGVATSDLYQLYAYTRRYGCARSVLLYPHATGVIPRDFDIVDSAGSLSGEQVRIRFANLHRDLHQESERNQLANELAQIVIDGLDSPADAPLPYIAGDVA